jgi:hypothetical protein
MAGYFTDINAFKLRSNMPPEFVDALEATQAGWFAGKNESVSRWIDARLSKRYATPFTAPIPETVLVWATHLMTWEAWQRRGYDPADLSMQQAIEDAKTARDEVKEAADCADGLFELPLRADTTAPGIVKGGPFGYTEASPYVWTTKQRCAATDEDANGDGTY